MQIFLVRIYEKKLWAVIKIQSHIRRMIAIRQYRKMRVSITVQVTEQNSFKYFQIEYRAKAEALKLKEKEQRELERKYGKKKAKEVAEQNFQERIEDLERQEYEEERRKEQKARLNQEKLKEAEMRKDQPIDDSAVVDDMFGFLEEQRDSVSESQAPSAFRDLPAPKNGYGTLSNGDIMMGVPTTPEDYEDLSDFKFPKFATTYFQGNVSHQYSRRPLKYSLMPLQTQGDQLVSCFSSIFYLLAEKFADLLKLSPEFNLSFTNIFLHVK